MCNLLLKLQIIHQPYFGETKPMKQYLIPAGLLMVMEARTTLRNIDIYCEILEIMVEIIYQAASPDFNFKYSSEK